MTEVFEDSKMCKQSVLTFSREFVGWFLKTFACLLTIYTKRSAEPCGRNIKASGTMIQFPHDKAHWWKYFIVVFEGCKVHQPESRNSNLRYDISILYTFSFRWKWIRLIKVLCGPCQSLFRKRRTGYSCQFQQYIQNNSKGNIAWSHPDRHAQRSKCLRSCSSRKHNNP